MGGGREKAVSEVGEHKAQGATTMVLLRRRELMVNEAKLEHGDICKDEEWRYGLKLTV